MNKIHFKRGVLFVLGFTLLISPTVSAIDEGFYSSNDILFYNPDDTCVEQTSTDTLSGSDNEQKTWNYFIAKDFSAKQVAGIIGNLQVEAPGIDPTTNQTGGGPGRGIVQWSVNERWAALKTWAGSRDIYSLQTQLDFIWYELNGSEKFAYEKFKPTTTIRDSTEVWMKYYERPGEPAFDRRLAEANEAYGRYNNGSSTIELATGTATSESSTGTNSPSSCVSGEGSGDIVSIAQAELRKGVREDPLGCDAGNPSIKGDCGPEVNKYTDNTLEWWCADFVSWVYKQAGKPFTGGSSAGGWRIAGVSAVAAWFKKNGTFTENGGAANPKPGDTYMVNGYDHIGIVEKVEGDTLYTISGNTSTDNTGNGNGVGARIYKNFRSDSSIDGFGSLSK